MEETTKRTDKFKKKSLGGFYSDFKMTSTRGKSSKELKLICEDLRKCVTHQLVRIKKLKYVIECYKQADVTKQLLTEKKRLAQVRETREKLKGRLKTRTDRVEILDGEIANLTEEVKKQQREIAKLNREVDKRDEKISEVRSRKARGFTRTVKVPLSEEAKRLERIANNGVPTKLVNNLEYVTRTALFLTEKKLTIDYLALIVKAEIMGNVKSRDLGVSYRTLTKLTNLGYLNVSTELKGAAKYWFVSLEGKKLIKDYKNKLSYGASILTQ